VPPDFVSPFQPGELVTHATHGIGRYVGIRQLQANDGSLADYFELEFAQGDRVFVPIENVARLSHNVDQDAAAARLIASSEHRSPYTRPQKPTTP